MTFPDPYHEQHWHGCPKDLHSHHLDPLGLHQTSQIICQINPWTKPSVKITFPDPYHEQHWHECPKHLRSHHLDPCGLHQTTNIICQRHFQIPTMNNMVGLGNRDLSNMSHMCASVEAMLLQMTAIKISGSFILHSFAYGRDLEMSSWHFALFKDHIYIYYVRFDGGHVGPVQMMAMKMFGTFMPVLFMIRVWKCHIDTWLTLEHV